MKRVLVAGVVIAGLVAASLPGTSSHGHGAAPQSWKSDPVPGTAAVCPRSRSWIRPAARSAGQLRGAGHFLFFGFVNCPDICPTTLATLAAAQKCSPTCRRRAPCSRVRQRGSRPRHPAVLGQYVAHFDPSFVGATGARGIDRRADAGARRRGDHRHASGCRQLWPLDHSAAIFLVNPEARVVALFGAPQ
jgi:protein SCO1/2